MTSYDLRLILARHALWLNDDPAGKRADLRGANLYDVNLRGADLTGADLRKAYLFRADLTGTTLTGADLSRANLRDADLSGTDLRYAYLRGADLSGADLSEADFGGANLRGAHLTDTCITRIDMRPHDILIVPERMFIGCEIFAHNVTDTELLETARKYKLSGEQTDAYIKAIRDGLERYKKEHEL
jgi:hypothetical protein